MANMTSRILLFAAGAFVFFLLFILFGGLYTITPPNGPVDTAYKMNRLTGKVWLVKTYAKQVGQIRVVTARESEVEKSKQFSESDIPSVAMEDATARDRRR